MTFFDALETGHGLDVILWLQAHGSAFLDTLASALYWLGGYPTFLLLFCALYWAGDRRLAKRLLVALLLSGLLVAAVKQGLERPRPYAVSPEVHALREEATFGFPSGHVGFGVACVGVLAAAIRRWWAWALAAGYAALMGWARMYAGVHYPQDVIAGLIIGVLAAWWCVTYWDAMNARWRRLAIRLRVGLLALAAGLAMLVLGRDTLALVSAGILLGAGVGFMVEARVAHAPPGGPLALRLVWIGIGLALGVLVLAPVFAFDLLDGPPLVPVALFTLVSLYAAAGWPWVMRRLAPASGQRPGAS